MPPKPLVTLRDALPTPALPQEAPKLKHEALHQRLARLTREHADVTQQLQALKRTKAQRSIEAQDRRQTISTAENNDFANKRRALAKQLLDIQTQIGATNKMLRQSNAAGNGNALKEPTQASPPKSGPLVTNLEYNVYFRLAAHSELPPPLYEQVERLAKKLFEDAQKMESSQPER